MTDKEKIDYLKRHFQHEIKWFKECEESEDYDDSYTYDMVYEKFSRNDCFTVLQILSED